MAPVTPFAPLDMCTQWRGSYVWARQQLSWDAGSASALTLNFPASRTVRNSFVCVFVCLFVCLFLTRCPDYSLFSEQPEWFLRQFPLIGGYFANHLQNGAEPHLFLKWLLYVVRVFVLVCICIGCCMCVGAGVCEHMKAKGQPWSPSSGTSYFDFFFLMRKSLLLEKAHGLALSTSQQVPGILLSMIPQHWNFKLHHYGPTCM